MPAAPGDGLSTRGPGGAHESQKGAPDTAACRKTSAWLAARVSGGASGTGHGGGSASGATPSRGGAGGRHVSQKGVPSRAAAFRAAAWPAATGIWSPSTVSGRLGSTSGALSRRGSSGCHASQKGAPEAAAATKAAA